jgi:Flp pilus assembly protein TadD
MRQDESSGSAEAAMKHWIACLIWALLLPGCASVEPMARPDLDVFRDALFEAPSQAPGVGDLFALTPAMRRYLDERIAPQVRRKGAHRALLDALYTQGELRLEYDAARTRTAGEAFDARRGNCLSLVIMTAVFARELGLDVRFQEVLETPAIEAGDGLTFVIGHVNLVLIDGLPALRGGQGGRGWTTVDFLPGQDLTRQRTREVDQRRITAQFMNNRAAEELVKGRASDAYWWLRAAAATDPDYSKLYNTLGVVYRQRGALPEAERALAAARALDPADEHVAGNLAGVRQALGLAALDKTAERVERARQALREGRLQQAVLLLRSELESSPHDPELHHLLAVALGRSGDAFQARRHLEQAAEFSANGAQRMIYAGKLERLKAQLESRLQ